MGAPTMAGRSGDGRADWLSTGVLVKLAADACDLRLGDPIHTQRARISSRVEQLVGVRVDPAVDEREDVFTDGADFPVDLLVGQIALC